MNTNSTKHCGTCGKPLASDTLLGLCPECMMKAGLESAPKATIRVADDAFVEGPETETKEFVPGTKLGYIGDYELLEEIARGGMGVVYRARQSSLKRIVAIKMIRAGELAGETEIRRFHAEAEAAAQLQHPNIVAIHEIGEHEGRQYFSMDFIAGKNLAQFADGKPVAARQAAEWLKTIAGAVQYAHQRGVLHRDLKPQNIMLDAEQRPCVTDFGLAKNLAVDSSLTASGIVMGSPNYMSPEQARGLNDLVGPASDVYSLGAILYELLTGRPPFRGKSAMDTMSQVVNDEPTPPRSVNSDAPVDLESICLKCLEKDPARRYPTARELETDLGRFLDGEPVQAKPANAFRKIMSWFRRHRWVLNAAVSVLVLGLMGLAYGLWEQTRFLTWLNAHSGFVQAPGPRKAALDALGQLALNFVLLVIPVIAVIFRKFTTGAAWGKIFEPPVRPPGLGTVLTFGTLSIIGCLAALFLAAKAIQVFVWEGVPIFWTLLGCVFPVFYFFFTLLVELVRQQRRIVSEPRPEYKASPEFHAALIWIFWGLVTFLASAWMWLAVPQPFSKTNLIPLGCGFAVVVSARFALFLFRQGSGSKSRWIESIGRMGSLCLALGILLIDFLFVLLVLFTPNANSTILHGQGLFTCGLILGGLLLFLLRKKLSPLPRLQATPALAPSISLSPEQLAPIHEAIFKGLTFDAINHYRAVTGADGSKGLAVITKMEAELKHSQPEKFSPGVLARPIVRPVFWNWLFLIAFWLFGLVLVFSNSPWWFFFLLVGMAGGAFIRLMSSNRMAGWKHAYRELRPFVKFLAWILVACFALAIPGFAMIIFALITHPSSPPDPEMLLFISGLIAGWLMIHIWLRKRKVP